MAKATDKRSGDKAGEGQAPRQGEGVGGRRSRAERSFAEREAGVASDPHVDENLDRGLEETFPASDPLSISPGAD